MKKTGFKIFAVITAAIGSLFAVYYFNLDMKFMRGVVVPFLNKHYDSIERRHVI